MSKKAPETSTDSGDSLTDEAIAEAAETLRRNDSKPWPLYPEFTLK